MKTIYIASPLPDDLAEDFERTAEKIRAAPRPSRYSREGAELVIRLTEACLDYYFLGSVQKLGLGTMANQATRIGLKTAVSGISVFVKQLSKRMSDEEVLHMIDLLEDLMLEVTEEDEADA
ncbi:MAG: hypothetical protein AAF725_04060 [Acidobacteriota bacterium]